jgi:GTPase SAR1 family protein
MYAKVGNMFRAVQDADAPSLPTGVYNAWRDGNGHTWFNKIPAPSDTSIDLPGTPTGYILDQIKTFWAAGDKYKEYGLLRKRGILMYGPPGCGKTCIIDQLCSEIYKANGIVFKIDDFRSIGDYISVFRKHEPDRPIMTLMEDMEGIFVGDAGKVQEKSALSFLDGQEQIDNVVHVGTTNHPQDIADRFIRRPGRFDVVIGIHPPGQDTREAYIRHLWGAKISESLIRELVVKTDGLALSYLRELAASYLCLGIPIDTTIERLRSNSKDKITNKTGYSIGFEIRE